MITTIRLAAVMAAAFFAILLSESTAHADCVERCWQNGNTYQCQSYCS